jgi:hypothetical protein
MSSSTQAVKPVRKQADIRLKELIAQPYRHRGVEGDFFASSQLLCNSVLTKLK